MITHPTQQEKNETTKRRMIRRTGLPVSCFAPFPSIVEVDFDPLRTAQAIVADAAPAPKDETARFRIEYRCTVTDSWIHFPSDETTIAASANDLLPRCRELACGQVGVKFRIIRPDGKRAIHRVAARPVKGRPSKLETYSWSS